MNGWKDLPSRRLLPAALLLAGGIVAAWLVYRPALSGGFYFDDLPGVVEASARHWQQLSWENLAGLTAPGVARARLVANATFGLDHLRGGLDPRVFHLSNLWIHLLAGLALAWAAALYAGSGGAPGGDRRSAPVAAALAAVVFLVHPLNTQAVSYIVQRMSALAGLFGILAFGCYLWARRRKAGKACLVAFGLSGMAWLMAVGSKENALVLPLVAVTYEACFHGAAWRRRLSGAWARPRLRLWAALAGAAAAGGVWWFLEFYPIWAEISLTETLGRCDCSGVQRMLSESRVHLLYLSLLVWPAPSRLNLDYDFAASTSLVDPPATLVAVAFWVAVFGLAVYLARRRPLWGFPLLAYFELHAMESGPIDLDLVFEHRMYLPMMFAALLVAALAAGLAGNRRSLLLAGLAVAVVPLAVATHQRNEVWADPIGLHRDVAAKSPDKVRAQYNLGTVLGQAGRFEEAKAALRRSVELDPGSSAAHNQLGSALLSTGDVGEALVEFEEAVRLDPENAEAAFNLAMALEQSGRYVEAADAYRRFLETAPPYLQHVKPQAEARLRWLAAFSAQRERAD